LLHAESMHYHVIIAKDLRSLLPVEAFQCLVS